MKKVLIVTYYWPPAGGPGVQRWLKFVKYLPGYGIEPIVYVPENPHYPLKDESLLAEIPSEIKVLKKTIFEPYAFAEIFSKKRYAKHQLRDHSEGAKTGNDPKADAVHSRELFYPRCPKVLGKTFSKIFVGLPAGASN